jgi:hypothetical protein
MCLNVCVHVVQQAHIGRKAGDENLWTAEPTNTPKKDHGNVKSTINRRKKGTKSPICSFVDLIFLHFAW